MIDEESIEDYIPPNWGVYTDLDRELCDLSSLVLEKCHLGIVPETISIEEV